MGLLGWIDALGFSAAALTLATFAQTSMRPMRVTAIAANVCFLGYAGFGGFMPILLLHGLLLPINIVRLRSLCAATPDAATRRPATDTGLRWEDRRDLPPALPAIAEPSLREASQ